MGKDEFPQFMRFPSLAEAVAGTYVIGTAQNTPVQQEDNIVMELLWVDFELNGASLNAIDGDATTEFQAQIVHRSQNALIGFNDSALIAHMKKVLFTQYAEATETGGAGGALDYLSRFELQDAKGKGILFAGTQLFLAVRGSSTSGGAIDVNARLAYRLVKLPLAEAIGLIQSWS